MPVAGNIAGKPARRKNPRSSCGRPRAGRARQGAGRKLKRGGIISIVTEREVSIAALKLDHENRAELARQLLASLEEEEEQLSPEQCEKLWTEEAERRNQDMEEGKVKGIPLEDALASARALLD